MKYRYIIYLLLMMISAFVAGCAGSVMEYTPTKSAEGKKGYFVKTVFGFLDGTKDQARNAIQKEANRLCPNGFSFVTEEEHPRKTGWGSKNGQVDLVWEISCTTNTN